MHGADLILMERIRQINEEGWTAEHDDKHTKGELAIAGASYAWPSPRPLDIKLAWPWDKKWWKPSTIYGIDPKARFEGRIRELVKAGALVAAEIDRLQRVMETNKELFRDGPFGLGHVDGSE